jgi:hypothetical protein
MTYPTASAEVLVAAASPESPVAAMPKRVDLKPKELASHRPMAYGMHGYGMWYMVYEGRYVICHMSYGIEGLHWEGWEDANRSIADEARFCDLPSAASSRRQKLPTAFILQE